MSQTLPGWLKATYRTTNGKRTGPYYVRYWKQAGTLHHQYVRKQDLERIKQATGAHREQRKRERAQRRSDRALMENAHFTARTLVRYYKGLPITAEQADHLARCAQDMRSEGRPRRAYKRRFVPPIAKSATPHICLLAYLKGVKARQRLRARMHKAIHTALEALHRQIQEEERQRFRRRIARKDARIKRELEHIGKEPDWYTQEMSQEDERDYAELFQSDRFRYLDHLRKKANNFTLEWQPPEGWEQGMEGWVQRNG